MANSSVRSLTSTVDPSASRNTAWAPGPVRTTSPSAMAAPASSASPGRRYRPPSADTTVARGPPGASIASMVSRPAYRTASDQCGCRGQWFPIASSGRTNAAAWQSPAVRPSAPPASARQAGQRLRWSSISTRRLPPSAPLRYGRKSGRNSAQPPPAALVTLSQTRARAASSVVSSTDSSLISCSALSSRSSDIADLHFDPQACRLTGVSASSRPARLRSVVDPGATSRLAFHFRLQPEPNPVQPDGDVVLLELEQTGQLFDSTAPRRDGAGTGLRRRSRRVATARRSCSFSSSGGSTAAAGAASS